MVEPSRWQDRCEEVLQEVLTITRHGIAEEELALAKRMCLDRVAEAAASQPWSFMGTLYGYDAAGTSREIVEALIASTPTGHLLTSATRFHEALRQDARFDTRRIRQVRWRLGNLAHECPCDQLHLVVCARFLGASGECARRPQSERRLSPGLGR
ncbi:unnamed protein product [Durusdinium trenchii]|uniref:Uncharacterized protein n=1 Tax=Durusdinium trenchii TaxID=1381693 RepID=A0ABP0QGY1_9DINO